MVLTGASIADSITFDGKTSVACSATFSLKTTQWNLMDPIISQWCPSGAIGVCGVTDHNVVVSVINGSHNADVNRSRI